MKTIQRYIVTESDAIKAAKKRASSRYRTQYVYRIEQDGAMVYFIRELPDTAYKPAFKVLYGGAIHALNEDVILLPVYRIRFLRNDIEQEVRWQMPDVPSTLDMVYNRYMGAITAIFSMAMMLPPEDWLEGNCWKRAARETGLYSLWCKYQETGIAEGFAAREFPCKETPV